MLLARIPFPVDRASNSACRLPTAPAGNESSACFDVARRGSTASTAGEPGASLTVHIYLPTRGTRLTRGHNTYKARHHHHDYHRRRHGKQNEK